MAFLPPGHTTHVFPFTSTRISLCFFFLSHFFILNTFSEAMRKLHLAFALDLLQVNWVYRQIDEYRPRSFSLSLSLSPPYGRRKVSSCCTTPPSFTYTHTKTLRASFENHLIGQVSNSNRETFFFFPSTGSDFFHRQKYSNNKEFMPQKFQIKTFFKINISHKNIFHGNKRKKQRFLKNETRPDRFIFKDSVKLSLSRGTREG